MTESQEKWLKNWKNKQKKGSIYYVVSQTVLLAWVLFLGRLIGIALLTNQSQWHEFYSTLPFFMTTILLFGGVLNSLAWRIGEWRYRHLTKPQQNSSQHI
ncbi:hypothetical protein VST7929_03118 [Vibrio stylophorae]|uniref:Uncharacterized protein n=1 Tax=Vibrio stylophorae TaxID=659351 RepID=A0ABN8E210_9VIBR|nr:hypothetical protein [Vibrio stylophorae]CAH0535566.1 hypothetical protein VST7929_03118 [Vibrio stylophorae]